MFSFFTAPEPELHPEAKTIGQYYEDLASAANNIRKQFNDNDLDEGFKQAADVISKLESIGTKLETVSAIEARSLNGERSELSKTIGSDGLINVEGEASKQLAIKFNALLQDLVDKKYWPPATCPSILGQSFLSKYSDGFEKRKIHWESSIEELQGRIDAYDNGARLKHVM